MSIIPVAGVSESVEFKVLCVNSIEEVKNAIREEELSNSTKYVTVKKDKLFGKTDIELPILMKADIRYEDTQKTTRPYITYDGVPFIIIGRKRMACHQGRNNYATQKARKKEQECQQETQMGDHSYKKKRKRIQDSKKKDCPAGIRIRHVIRFPEFKLGEHAKRSEKDSGSVALKQLLHNDKSVKMEHAYYISIPETSEHKNHVMGEDAAIIQPIDYELKKYIGLMVSQHQVSNTFQMKLLLEVYVKQVLFSGDAIPSRLNKRFWPSTKDIKNHMALALLRLRNTNVDQAVVSELVNKWKVEYPSDAFFIRIKENEEEQDINEFPVCLDSEEPFSALYVH